MLCALCLQEVASKHDDLMLVLAPYLHLNRYTSYGRHFTATQLLEETVAR